MTILRRGKGIQVVRYEAGETGFGFDRYGNINVEDKELEYRVSDACIEWYRRDGYENHRFSGPGPDVYVQWTTEPEENEFGLVTP
jgi:hypothetical protein